MASITLLDGGMGQELVRRSGKAPTPLWSVRVMLDNPDLVKELHIDFINAGAKVIALNNYTATPARLARDASADLLLPIHQAAKKAALSAREKSGANDVQIVETMSTIREAVAAATAAREAGLPTVVSFTLDDEDPLSLRSGEPLLAAVEAVAPLGVMAVSVNCSMPEVVSEAMPALTSAFVCAGGYANGFRSVAPLDAGGTTAGLKRREDLTPDAYAQYALGWAKSGAKIIGGCCEVGPEHIAKTAEALMAAGYDCTGFNLG